MSYCTPCPPCDANFPLLCDPLETTANGKRLVVEDSAACQKTIQTPVAQQVLKTDGAGNLTWTNGASGTVLRKDTTGLLEFATLNNVLQSGPVDLGSQPLTTSGSVTSKNLTGTDNNITFINTSNTVGMQGMRLSFDNDRMTFQRASDSGVFEANYVSINQNDGRVGINQTVPQADLHINGRLCFGNSNGLQMSISNDYGTNDYLTLQAGVNGIRTTNFINTLTHVAITEPDGFVGLGVINPSSKLEIFGDLTLTSTSTTTAAVAGIRVLPSNPVDFLVVKINGNTRGIPFYEV